MPQIVELLFSNTSSICLDIPNNLILVFLSEPKPELCLNISNFSSYFEPHLDFKLNLNLNWDSQIDLKSNFNFNRQIDSINNFIHNFVTNNSRSQLVTSKFNFIMDTRNTDNLHQIRCLLAERRWVLLATLLYCLQHVFIRLGVSLYRLLLIILGFLRGLTPLTLLLLLFFSQFVFVNGVIVTHNMPQLLVGTIGWVVYAFLVNPAYDYFFNRYNNSRSHRGFYNLHTLGYRVVIGLLWYATILLGVVFSTAFWQVIGQNFIINYLYYGLSAGYPISALFGSIWIYYARAALFTNHQFLRISLLRGICESVLFNAMSWVTYAVWYLLSLLNITGLAYITFLGGLFLYIPIAYYQIHLEHTLGLYILSIYGAIYSISFTLMAISTNGLYMFIDMYANDSARFTLLVLTGIMVFLAPLEAYRSHSEEHILSIINRLRRSPHWRTILLDLAYQYAAFAAFAIHMYLLFPYWDGFL